MGMFDYIDGVPPTKCVTCGHELNGWQSKDGPCGLDALPFWHVDNFYVGCEQCWTWHEWHLRRPRIARPITDYELVATESDSAYKPEFIDGKWTKGKQYK